TYADGTALQCGRVGSRLFLEYLESETNMKDLLSNFFYEKLIPYFIILFIFFVFLYRSNTLIQNIYIYETV
ncbi:MAG: hypothetical protein KBS65_02085, partial [Prevotella sp.]|nr:hypothetical protein [Candidatus Equicola stercoris]